jgi:signal transduction histidine kinase/ABC-type amino acid transport substrate-binding protein
MVLKNQKILRKINCLQRKKIFLLAFGFFILFHLIFNYSHASEIKEIADSTGNISSNITIASELNYPPYCIIDDDGNPDGFSVELFKETAAAVGLEVDIKIGVWNQIRKNLAEGKIDALPLVSRTQDREVLYDFTMPYLILHGAVFVRIERDDIHSLADLKGKSVAVMRGSSAEEFARRENISGYITVTNTYEEAFQNLSMGNYDAVLTQRIMGIRLLDEMGLNNIKALDLQIPQFRHEFCFAVQKGNIQLLERLNEGLSIVIADGTYDSVRLKWLSPQIMEEISLNRVLIIALHVFFPLFLIFLLASIFILRKQINKRTSSLKAGVQEHKETLDIFRKQQLLLNEMESISSIGGWEYDVETGRVNCTDGVYEIYGVSQKENPLSSYEVDSSFYLPAAREKLDTAFQKTLKTGEPYDLVLEFKSADGIKKWVRTIGKAEMENGKAKRLYGNIVDVTKQVQAESELRKLKDELEKQIDQRTAQLEEHVGKLDKSQKALLYMVEDLNEITAELKAERKKLEEANQELEAFTYSVSHDLRAPLRAINGFSNFLMEDYAEKLDKEGKRHINTIRGNALKMDQLITDLLNLSRVSRAKVKLIDVNMNDIVKSIYQVIATEKDKKEFDLIVHDMPLIKCDPGLMKQVWQNLISNALKYSSKSERKKIEIGFKKVNKEIVFFLKDLGVGFNPKYTDKLFGVFQRLHREEEFEGTGVGLAIVKRIISRHGGRIWAEGEENKGATFYFSLPL